MNRLDLTLAFFHQKYFIFLNWYFRLEPPSGIILSVTELIPETFKTNKDDMNIDRDSNPESSSQRNVTEDDRENQKVFYLIKGENPIQIINGTLIP